jgi:hypothetical protein
MSTTNNTPPMALDEVRKLRMVKGKASDEKKSEVEKLTKIVVENEVIDGLLYPKGSISTGVPFGERTTKNLGESDGFRPSFADLDYIPKLELKKNRKPIFFDKNIMTQQAGVKTIFGADNRRVYYSTAYPWRCVGRVESPLGFASGVMIGPRHFNLFSYH